MPLVGATTFDVLNEYRTHLARLPIHSAFALFDYNRNMFVLTTFLEDVNHTVEQELAKVDGHMIDSFSEYLLDFRTIHLGGRDVANFIPQGAVPLIQPPKPGTARGTAR